MIPFGRSTVHLLCQRLHNGRQVGLQHVSNLRGYFDINQDPKTLQQSLYYHLEGATSHYPLDHIHYTR